MVMDFRDKTFLESNFERKVGNLKYSFLSLWMEKQRFEDPRLTLQVMFSQDLKESFESLLPNPIYYLAMNVAN